MPSDKSYVLFCAGEDSGDVIGEALVKAVLAEGRFAAVGCGGSRMQKAGLRPVVDYEDLPVSGFGDVLPKYFKLRKSFAALKSALESPDCLGLVAIDYPGFNMKLTKRAGELHKRVLYVAPPQVWAWKRRRATELAKNPFVRLAVFFDFEERVIREAGCNVVRVRHPFFNSEFGIQSSELNNSVCLESKSDDILEDSLSSKILLLPGSRKAQALRNLPIFLRAVADSQNVVVVAARQELVPAFEKFGVQVVVAPQNAEERMELYRSASFAISAPGTATLELALSGIPFAVCTKPDLLTYGLGRLFVKTKYFALPNIVLDRSVFPEYIVAPFSRNKEMQRWFAAVAALPRDDVRGELRQKLAVGNSLQDLAFEFLGELVEGESQ